MFGKYRKYGIYRIHKMTTSDIKTSEVVGHVSARSSEECGRLMEGFRKYITHPYSTGVRHHEFLAIEFLRPCNATNP